MRNTRIHTFLLTLGCAASAIFSTPFLQAEASSSEVEISQLKTLSQGFVAVGKKAIPAVVSIKVKINSSKSSLGDYNPWGGQNDDSEMGQFWGQFFNFRGNDRGKSEEYLAQASGFIVTKNGYILTNSHVVQDASEINVVLNDGREFIAKLVGSDPSTDIAVVKIDAADLPILALGNSDQLQPGQWVIAIGSPMELKASLTVGIISATGRNDLSIARIEDFIQTDAAINRGNSGGPLLNLDGEVIGINTAIAAGGYTGIGFAVPSNIAKNDLDQILTKGVVTRGFLGVTLQKIDKDLATAFHLDNHEGALIADVAKGTPAEKAGLQTGDVIVKINKAPVATVAGLRNTIALMVPGTKITLGLLRDGKPLEISVEVGDFPAAASLAKSSGHIDQKLGITVENITPLEAQKLNLNATGGVMIKKVEAGSLAAWAGLKKGAVILEINKTKIATVEQYNDILKQAIESKPILLLVKQGDVVQYLSIKAG